MDCFDHPNNFYKYLVINKFDERSFLRYGALRIDEYPKRLKIIKYKTYGTSDFEAEYYISIDASDFNKLLSSREYTIVDVETQKTE